MICPKCASAHTMSTTKKESFRVTWMVAGWKDLREDAEIKAVTHPIKALANRLKNEMKDMDE